ncbi:hypothetical protein B0A55_04774 [Friedmanniomyces simplex]|uniref:Aromatic amino acid beta-eliminating lyase/threonine aldolase domain-containing protein n=1 Tax=Friedmanniomyces simplex TaxID=329884 RepID=A0A4U0XLT2_9PEZI|nr:hypothetical protein B0A55_04774 [Friedmanniomyces simplex]
MDYPTPPRDGEIHVLPSNEAIKTARSKLLPSLPEHGLGADHIKAHLRNDIVPGLNRSSQSPNYYGFVTGGATPVAAFADNIVTETDQNVQVHLPHETVSTDVEDRALSMIEKYSSLNAGVAGLELADSIAGDAHKLLNVPYDCGIFLSKHLDLSTNVFGNPNAAYLNTASSESTASSDRTIPSPLNVGIENSRRFRALPVYATLAAYGREGYRRMLERQVELARGIAEYLLQSKGYELLPQPLSREVSDAERIGSIYIIVLFRARDDQLNKVLVQRLNATRRLYVSGTQWEGLPAVRFAIANWQADVERDLQLVREVFSDAVS